MKACIRCDAPLVSTDTLCYFHAKVQDRLLTEYYERWVYDENGRALRPANETDDGEVAEDEHTYVDYKWVPLRAILQEVR